MRVGTDFFEGLYRQNIHTTPTGKEANMAICFSSYCRISSRRNSAVHPHLKPSPEIAAPARWILPKSDINSKTSRYKLLIQLFSGLLPNYSRMNRIKDVNECNTNPLAWRKAAFSTLLFLKPRQKRMRHTQSQHHNRTPFNSYQKSRAARK